MKKMIIFTFFLLICIYNTPVMGNTILNQAEEYSTSGIKLFKDKQFNESYTMLQKAFLLSPGNSELNFYLGRAAFETGKYEEAVMAFERILIALPNENRVKLELARAFQKLGSNDIARGYCKEVLLTEPPESVQRNIEAFLLQINESERRHFLTGRIITGVDWDNNVWASPTDGIIETAIGYVTLTGVAAKKEEDWIVNTTMEVQHAYRFINSNDSWKTDLVFYNADYNDTSLLDTRYISGSTGPELISDNTRIGLKLFLSQIELNHTQYLQNAGFKAELDYVLRPGLITGYNVKFEKKNYVDNIAMDAQNVSLLFDLSLSQKKNWYNVNLKLETENASNDEYSFNRLGLGLSFTRVLPLNFIGSLNYEYQYSQYDEKATLFNKQRQDNQHKIGYVLKKTIWQSVKKNKDLAVNLNYRHTWTDSNIALYKYNKDLVQCSLEFGF